METKLTLKLDADVIHSVKRYARISGKSLSGLVENYFRNLVAESPPDTVYTPLVRELSGVITEKDLQDADYEGYLEAKYE